MRGVRGDGMGGDVGSVGERGQVTGVHFELSGITHDLEPVLCKGSPLGMPGIVADAPKTFHRDEVGVGSRA